MKVNAKEYQEEMSKQFYALSKETREAQRAIIQVYPKWGQKQEVIFYVK